MIKIPYGISNFETLVTKGLYYVDRTKYIETLENFFSRYLVFVRPRRFGKSLFISTLEYYYGLQHKDKFQQLFGNYYIGQHPTLSANQYLILKLDFSQINTASFEATYDAFLENIKDGGLNFLSAYPHFFDKDDLQEIKACTTPVQVLQTLLRQARFKAAAHKLYLLIDEYDHFANEILSFRFKEFTKIVGQNGFVRKFYEAIKVGTHSGVIDRIFITGVSPLTLDSLTSGFNIATNISLEDTFNGMMGFKEKEVLDILKGIEVPTIDLPDTVALMKKWYDGYLFSKTAAERLYNSDMVLYFAAGYAQKKQFPEILLDPNIASDYTKVRRLFKVKDQETAHLTYLEELLKNREITSSLVQLFEIDKRFDRKDFISLLYYTGILTIKGSDWANVVFKMPNYVIEQLVVFVANEEHFIEI